MLFTLQSLLSLFSLLCSLVQAKPHANPQWHHHHSRASSAKADSGSKIGLVYDGTSNLGAFSGKIGFSVDWSPLPLSSADNLNLGAFIPQLWTFQDSNRELLHRQTFYRY